MQHVSPLSQRGAEILHSPLLNKGTAFSQEERDLLHLNGLLPVHISTVEEQLKRCHQNFNGKKTPLGKYSYLSSLINRNELLFYQFVFRYIGEMLPYIYTPTVGEAAIHYSLIYSQQRGLYLSYPLLDKLDEMIGNIPNEEVQAIVVTDGERILGLGDQGIGGMTIPVGKLSLYTLFAGIHPARTLPVMLDVGTNHPDLLKDELYLGWRHPRLVGEEYDHFIDRFIKAIKKRYPRALIQWEDFGKGNARRVLSRYRKEILSFNDDIQGTAAVSLAAILAALKEINANLSTQKIAILGGGSAGIGIADMLVQAMMKQGLSQEEARRKIFIVDIHGLIHFNTPNVSEEQRPYSHPHETFKEWKIVNFDHITLQEVIANANPTILIGVSAQPRAFTEEIVRRMAKNTPRPLIFPLSNPTSKAEATPQELLDWTLGKAIVATGSPFQPAHYKEKAFASSQCNNVYIFPGIGLGSLAAEASQITDSMFLIAAETLSSLSPALQNPSASLFPPIEEVRAASRKIAEAVALQAIQEGVSSIQRGEIQARLDALIWEPAYPRYVPK